MLNEMDTIGEAQITFLQDNYEKVSPGFLQGVGSDKGSLQTAASNHTHIFLRQKHTAHGEVFTPFGPHYPITAQEVKIVQDLIHYLDSKSTVALGLPSNQKHLKDEGKKIDHIHPLCFTWAIVKERSLRSKLRSFRDNSAFSLKWNGFMGYSAFHDKGLGKNLERYYNHKHPAEFEQEFKNFCHVLHLKEEKIMPHVMIKSWRGFASALVEEDNYF